MYSKRKDINESVQQHLNHSYNDWVFQVEKMEEVVLWFAMLLHCHRGSRILLDCDGLRNSQCWQHQQNQTERLYQGKSAQQV